jgi:hypothetical protein
MHKGDISLHKNVCGPSPAWQIADGSERGSVLRSDDELRIDHFNGSGKLEFKKEKLQWFNYCLYILRTFQPVPGVAALSEDLTLTVSGFFPLTDPV